MAKFFGKIGFSVTDNIRPGSWKPTLTKREYYGDWNRNTSHYQSTDHENDDLTISNELSIISDPFAMENFHSMRYVEYMGARWKITKVEVRFPRLILTIGGVFNGDQVGASQPPMPNP